MPSIARTITKFTKKEIDLFFANARRILKHPAFTILLASAQKDFGRILIITSRKVGTAPVRNKIRRRIKSIFYEAKLFELPFDCAVIVRSQAKALSFDELKKLILDTYLRATQKK